MEAKWEIKSVNDPFTLLMSDFTSAFTLTEASSENGFALYTNVSSDNNLITLYEDDISQAEGKVLSLLLYDSYDEESSLFIVEDIDSDLSFSAVNNNESLVSIFLDENKLNFNTIENMNGETSINLFISDGEFDEQIEINIEVLQVNDPINLNYLSIEDGIKDYYINKQSMFSTISNNNFIKFQSYLPENFPTPDNYEQEHLYMLNSSLQDLKPVEPDDIYFKWDNNHDYFQDVDTNPLYNSENNLYTIYYRLELLDDDGKVYVLKDNIHFSNGVYDETNDLAKVAVNIMSDGLNTYHIDDINQCDYNIEYNEESDNLNINGEILYKWRISARNNIINDLDFETNSEIACTPWSTLDQFYIDMIYPEINYNFILNDIYIDFFDVYMNPSEPLTFFDGQDLYIHYNNSQNYVEEIVDIIDLEIENEEIYFSSDNFDQFGSAGFTFILSDTVGNINIAHDYKDFNFITPGVFNSFTTPNELASIEIPPINHQANILIYELPVHSFGHNKNSIISMISIQSNGDFIYTLKFSLDEIDRNLYTNLTDLEIFTELDSDSIKIFNTFYDSESIYSIVDTFGRFGVKVNSDTMNEQEIPEEINMLKKYGSKLKMLSKLPDSLLKTALDKFNLDSTYVSYILENKASLPDIIDSLNVPDKGNFIIVLGKPEQKVFASKVFKNMKNGCGVDVHHIILPEGPGLAELSDHMNYWKYGYNAVMINDTSFLRNPNYHLISDTIDTLNFDKMTEVVKGVYNSVRLF